MVLALATERRRALPPKCRASVLMKKYRLYVVTAEENISSTFERHFPDDREALTQAERLRAEQHAVEVWNDDRLVGRIGGAFDFGHPR